jgi:hypothetical protein
MEMKMINDILKAKDPIKKLCDQAYIKPLSEEYEQLIFTIENKNNLYMDTISKIYYICNYVSSRKDYIEEFILSLIGTHQESTAIDGYIRRIGQRWPEIEHIVKQNVYSIYNYAKYAIKRRWPEVEDFILKKKNVQIIWLYIKNIIKGRWIEAEEIIEDDLFYSYLYSKLVGIEMWV